MSRVYEESRAVAALTGSLKNMAAPSLRRLKGRIDAELEKSRHAEFWKKAEQAKRRGHTLATFPIPPRKEAQ